MGEYLTIIWESEAPSAVSVEWDKAMLIVKGSEASLTETEVIAVENSTWASQLADKGFSQSSQAYKSTSQFFAASPTPGGTLYVLALVSGTVDSYTDTPLLKVSSNIYETPIKPPLGFIGTEQVKYFPDATKTGYFINKADGTAGVGFTVVNDGFSKWTGRLNFLSGLSGFAIDNPPLTGSKVTANFKVGSSTAEVAETIEQYGISLMAAAYPNSKTKTNYGTDCYYGSMLEDLSRFTNAIAGQDCNFLWSMPGGALPTAVATGLGGNWGDIKGIVGIREDVSIINLIPSALNHDMAAGIMGMLAGEHPHKTLTFKPIHMGLDRPADNIERSYWKEAQVISSMQKRQLDGSPNLVTYGFTLGTGYSSRINYVRCKYIVAKNLVNGLWALLASRKVVMSYAGMQLVKSKIEGIFKTLISQGIIDGLAYVNIPIEQDLKNNTAAGSAARLAREIPSIEIGFYWFSSLEKITITGIRNEA